MINVSSVYNHIDKYLNVFPVWKIDKEKFSLVPYSINYPYLSDEKVLIEFNIVRSYDSCKIIPLNTWRKVSNKAKFFLFQHFTNLKNYTEYMYLEDKHISITIEF